MTLGFDPTPGEPSAVAAVLDELEQARRVLDDCAADLPLAPAGWTGTAADAYRTRVATLPAALTDTGTSIATAERVLTTWLGRLIANKRETERLDALATRLRSALDTAAEPARTELDAELGRTIAAAVRLRARHMRQAVEAALSLDGRTLPGWPAPVVDGVAGTAGEVGDWTEYLARFGSVETTADGEVPELVELPDPGTAVAAVVDVPLDQARPLRAVEDLRPPVPVQPEPRPPGVAPPPVAATTRAARTAVQPRSGRRRRADRADTPHRTAEAPRGVGAEPSRSAPARAGHDGPRRVEPAPGRDARPVPGPLVERPGRVDLDRVSTASATVEASRQPLAEPPRPTAPEPPDPGRSTGGAEPGRPGGEPARLVGADPGQRATPSPSPTPQKTTQPSADPDAAALLLTGALPDLDADTVVRPTGRLGTYLLCTGDQQVLVLAEEHGGVVRRTVCLPVG